MSEPKVIAFRSATVLATEYEAARLQRAREDMYWQQYATPTYLRVDADFDAWIDRKRQETLTGDIAP